MFFKNIAVNLQATGIAAVFIVWILCITALGIFGGEFSGLALGGMLGLGVGLVGAISQNVKHPNEKDSS